MCKLVYQDQVAIWHAISQYNMVYHMAIILYHIAIYYMLYHIMLYHKYSYMLYHIAIETAMFSWRQELRELYGS